MHVNTNCGNVCLIAAAVFSKIKHADRSVWLRRGRTDPWSSEINDFVLETKAAFQLKLSRVMWKKAKRGMNHEPILKNITSGPVTCHLLCGRSYGVTLTVLELEVGSIGVCYVWSHNHQ